MFECSLPYGNDAPCRLTDSGRDGGGAAVDGRRLAHLSSSHLIEHVTKTVDSLINTRLEDRWQGGREREDGEKNTNVAITEIVHETATIVPYINSSNLQEVVSVYRRLTKETVLDVRQFSSTSL